ncbi:hypothetical protein TanjilG_28913 [Lupinus angustifolius]|uniref:Auxin-induced protein n=1 Tax=Lupinus angustifolius TaxID=3871 RepID=A0A4P1QXL0_LUPAN|nr:hypothetical protein TanjilG_28913 [Lupinus angustifolius]
MACMWQKHGGDGNGKNPPADVPRGHVAVTVGEGKRRFVIRADYLNHLVLQQLLDQANEGYGFNKSGPLAIHCDEFLFEDIIHSLRNGTNSCQPSCYVPLKKIGLSMWNLCHYFRDLIANGGVAAEKVVSMADILRA